MRPVSDFRIGILTVKEKWEKYYKSVSVQMADYLSANFLLKIEKDNLWKCRGLTLFSFNNRN